VLTIKCVTKVITGFSKQDITVCPADTAPEPMINSSVSRKGTAEIPSNGASPMKKKEGTGDDDFGDDDSGDDDFGDDSGDDWVFLEDDNVGRKPNGK
jgi:hypothetical protein